VSDRHVCRRLLRPSILALLGAVPLAVAASLPVPDPTRPAVPLPAPEATPATPATAAPALVLQSTLIAGEQSSVIINGQRLRRGDRLGDARVAAIGPGWVRLESAAGSTELRLSHSSSSFVRPVNR